MPPMAANGGQRSLSPQTLVRPVIPGDRLIQDALVRHRSVTPRPCMIRSPPSCPTRAGRLGATEKSGSRCEEPPWDGGRCRPGREHVVRRSGYGRSARRAHAETFQPRTGRLRTRATPGAAPRSAHETDWCPGTASARRVLGDSGRAPVQRTTRRCPRLVVGTASGSPLACLVVSAHTAPRISLATEVATSSGA